MPKLIKRKTTTTFDPDSLFFSDLHLHDRQEFTRIDPITGLNVRLMEGLNVLDQIFEICLNNPKIKTLYFLGDWTELKDRIPNHILIELKRRLLRFMMIGVKIISLLGNHDYNLPNYPTMSIFEAEDILKLEGESGETRWMTVKSLDVIQEYPFRFIKISGWDSGVYFIPFQRQWGDFEKEWKIAHQQDPKPTIICMHQEVPDAVYETGKKITGVWGLQTDPDILYLSGHLHKPQKVHGIQFLGSPYEIKFSDQQQDRYIWLYNSKTKELQPLQLNYSKFITLNYHELDFPSKENFKTIVNGNYVRIDGEVFKEDWDLKTKKTLKENFEECGAKAVVFNIKVKHPSQPELTEGSVVDDVSIIRQYAKDHFKEAGLELERLTKIGEGLYENL